MTTPRGVCNRGSLNGPMDQAMPATTVTRIAAGWWVLLLLCCGPAEAAGEWRVPQAELRFTLKLTRKPTHTSAGYFVTLPDGGVLPGRFPVPTVMATSGKVASGARRRRADPAEELGEIESYTLWHSKEGGLSIVFADPGKQVKAVDVYVTGWTKPKLWNSETGLTPSALLCTDPTKASMPTARGIAKPGSVGPTVHVRNKAGIRQAPFSIGGDDSGRPRPGSFYLLSYLNVTDPGKTWIAPFVIDGECELRVDGAVLRPKRRIDKWGGTGQYVDLKAGLHRVEVLQTAPGTGPYSSHGKKGGLMYLTWRPPGATMKELGGVRSKKVPMSGTSRMETRLIQDREIVRSGTCTLMGALGRDGTPVACILARPAQTFWFGNEMPLLVYELRALTGAQPAGTTYQWSLPGGSRVAAESLRWLFPGFRENRVTLTATTGKQTTRCVASFFGFSTTRTSLASGLDREAYREAFTTMLEAGPTDPDPAAGWDTAYWNNLIRTSEMGHGYPLLHNLFTVRRETVRKRLGPVQMAALEDIYLDMLQQREPKEAMVRIDELLTAKPGAIRRDALLIRKAEVLMFYLNDRESAARGLATLAEAKGEMAEWARIRLGDLAFLDGDFNKATGYYAGVQGTARMQRNRLDRLVTEDLLKTDPANNKKGDQPGQARPTAGEPPAPGEILPFDGSNWRVGALRDVSNSENIRKLIDGGFLLEARQALREWERGFPLSKISGDLLLVKARYHMKLGDWMRARVMLEAYCREVDASSFLPDAARLLITCVEEMKTPRHEIRDLIEKVKKRLEYHPVAKELGEFLQMKK